MLRNIVNGWRKNIILLNLNIHLEKLLVEVVNLHHYNTFEELFKHFDKVSMGYKEDEIAKPSDMEEYYSKEEQSKYGVLGIEIKKI